MEFKYTATLWVEPSDIEEMLKLCHQGYTYEQAINEVAASWEDADYYAVDYITSQLVLELKRRLEAERS